MIHGSQGYPIRFPKVCQANSKTNDWKLQKFWNKSRNSPFIGMKRRWDSQLVQTMQDLMRGPFFVPAFVQGRGSPVLWGQLQEANPLFSESLVVSMIFWWLRNDVAEIWMVNKLIRLAPQSLRSVMKGLYSNSPLFPVGNVDLFMVIPA